MSRPAAFPVAVAIGALLCLASTSQACSVPVFRYAIERWEPDEFSIAVAGRGAAGSQLGAQVDAWRKRAGDAFLNAWIEWADAADPAIAKRLALPADAALPQVVVRPAYGRADGSDDWRMGYGAEAEELVLDSPARRGLVKRLTEGDSVVWLFLPCGDALRDKAARETLAGELARLEKAIELPAIEEEEGRWAGLKLALRLRIMDVDRTAPAERFFVHDLLAGVEGAASAPVAIAVFGRGRALPPLVGADIKRESIAEDCFFLCGSCSCEIKQLNPGRDLLLAADWETVVDDSRKALAAIVDAAAARPAAGSAAADARPAAAPAAKAAPEVVVMPAPVDAPAPAAAAAAPRSGTARLAVVIASGIAVLVLLAAWMAGQRR